MMMMMMMTMTLDDHLLMQVIGLGWVGWPSYDICI